MNISIWKRFLCTVLLFIGSAAWAQTTAPGGVTSGLQHWLRADNPSITVTGTAMDFWPDASGNNRGMYKATGTTSPAILANNLNFNPVVYFDGTTAYTKTSAQGLHTFTSGYTAAEAFGFVKGADNLSRGYPFDYGSSSRGSHWLWSNSAIYDGFGTTLRLGYNPVSKAIAEAKTGATVSGSFNPLEWGLYNVRSAVNNWGVNHNSNTIVTGTTNAISFAYVSASQGVEIGNYSSAKWKGWMPEVAMYNRVLTASERNQVNTYFAIKYGMPLSHNFVGPTGGVLWDRTANAAYNNNFVSIGRSDVQALHQRQGSVWLNSGLLSVGNNNVIDLVKGNSSTAGNDIATNESYLIVGDNGLTPDWVYSGSLTNANQLLTTVWKAQETGTIGSVKLNFYTGLSGTTSSIPGIADATSKVFLMVSPDNNFTDTNNTQIPLTRDGNNWAVNVDLNNGDFFTLALDLSAPGGVASGLQHWLRADNPSITPSGTSLDFWPDASGNSRSMYKATGTVSPTLLSNNLNFNPVVYFDGATAFAKTSAQGLHTFTSGYSAAEVFGFVKGADNASRGYPYDYGTSVRGNHWLWSNSNLYESFASSTRIAFNPLTRAITEAKTGATVSGSFNPFEWGLFNVRSATNIWGINHNTSIIASGNTNAVSFAYGSASNGVETGSHGGGKWKGWMPEVVLYNKVLSADDRNKINTYFAIKYGMPLTHNYVGPTGTALWDRTANAAFSNNMVSIGRSDAQALHQRQGRAWLNSGVISVGNNDIIDFVKGNSSTAGNDIATNESYLIIGDNNVAMAWTPTGAPAGQFSILTRTWRAQEVNTIGSVRLRFNTAGTTGATAFLPNAASANLGFYLVVSTDNVFTDASDVRTPMVYDATTKTWSVNVNLPSGASFFTIIKDLNGPGCVSAGPVWWFSADAPGSAPATIWQDLSGNEANVTAPASVTFTAPASNTRSINFNPVYSFNGTTQYFSNPNYTFSNAAQEHFVVSVLGGTTNLRDVLGVTAGVNYPFTVVRFNGGNFPVFASATETINGFALGNTLLNNTVSLVHGGKNTTSSTNNSFIQFNGTQGQTLATNTVTGPTSLLTIGAGRLGTAGALTIANFFQGDLAEVVSYDQTLTITDRQRVATYLAIKYGIGLNHDYLSGTGVKWWDYTANSVYFNNIFGIGRDDCQGLHQRQSRASNPQGLITIGNNNIIAAGNSSTAGNNIAADGQYMLLGHDNGSLNYAAVNAAGYHTLDRFWKVSASGISAVKLSLPAFGNTSATVTLPATITEFSNEDKLYLVVDPNGDGNLSDATYSAMSKAGSGVTSTWEINTTLANNAVITFAVKRNTTDSDSDGVQDLADLDDDADGVLDAVESPTCYAAITEWNSLYKPNGEVAISSDLSITLPADNLTLLTDNNLTASAVVFGTAQAQLNKALFRFEFRQPTRLDAIYLVKNSATQILNNNVILQGSNDNTVWTDLWATAAAVPANATNVTAVGSVSLANSNKFTVNQNGAAYKYYRIFGATAANTLGGVATEFYFDINATAWNSGFYPKASCSTDTDGDGKLNHQDTDSDGDGCNDAVEAKVGSTTAIVPLAGPVGVNGFLDALETASESGLYNNTYDYSTAFALNSGLKRCDDNDRDGVSDFDDIDDDNDGVLDFEEQGKCVFANYDLSKFTFTGTTTVTVSGTNISTSYGATNSWGSKYSDQSLKLPIHLEWTTSASGLGMIGLLPEGNAKTPATWTDGSYKIYHNNATLNVYTPTALVPNLNPTYTANQKMEIDINENGVVTMKQGGNLIYRFQGRVSKYSLVLSTYSGSKNYQNVILTSWTPNLTCTDIDTDQDGVVNRFDLDSDDDGCNDGVEAGAVALGTAAPLAGSVGINGFVDTIETAADSNEPKYFSSYPYYAIVRTKIVCDDQDNDGIGNITDVDSDNDGVPDDVEQNCYAPLFINEVSDATNKTLSGMMLVGQDSITYKMVATGPAVSYTNTNFVDGNGIHFMINDGTKRQLNLNLLLQSFADEQSFQAPSIKYVDFGPHVPLNRAASGIASDPQNILLSWPGAYGVVFDPANELSSHNTGDRISNGDLIVQNGTLAFSAAPVPKWKVRLFIASAIDSLNISASIFETGGGGLNNEGYGFNLSACANNDNDGDNLPNEVDTDSDGDGCSDAYEAGATTVAGTSVIVGTYGANGFVSTLESDDTDLAVQNYSPTYSRAQNAAFNLCLDTDSDGISDVTDIDDDNDGILDEDENACGTALFTPPLSSTVSGSRQKFKGTLSKGNAGADYTINLIGVSGSGSLFDNSKGGLHYNLTDNNTIFSQTYYINPNSGSAINQVNWGVNVTSNQTAGSAVVEAQSITLNWNPDVRARVFDPNDQLVNLATDDLIATGTVIQTRANANASATTWRLEFITPGLTVPFFLQASHSANSTVNADAWGIYADLCYLGDPDGDKVVNSLDLDSDGDSCGDAFEAGATLTPGGATLVLTGSVGTNGLVNTVETNDTQTASINYPSTNFQAYSPTSACADTDNDGVPDREDLDSDNDGIMNYAEYECGPGVFVKSYVISTATNKSFGGTYNNGNFRASTSATFSNLNSILTLSDNTNAGNFKVNDDNTDYRVKVLIAPTNGILAGISFGPSLPGNTENAAVINQQQTISLTWNYPIGGYISDPDDQLSSHTDGQGINPGDVVVTRAAYAAGTSTWKMVLPLSFLTTELSFEASFISSTTFGDETWGVSADVCNRLTDPDKDGITNATDPDSDGDNCFDAVEAGHNKNETLTSQTVPGPFGQNGLTSLLENNDTRFAQTSYSLSLNYTNGLVKGCADLDADFNPDVTDIDDDGDGIPDQTECPVDPPLTSFTLVRANSEGSVVNIVSNTGVVIGRITSRVPVFRKYFELFARMTPNNLDKSVVGIASDGYGGAGTWWRATKASDLRVGELVIEPVGVAALNLRLIINEGANGPCAFNPRSLKLDAGSAGKGVIKSIPQPNLLTEPYKVGDSLSRDMPITTAFPKPGLLGPGPNKNFIQIQYTLGATVSNPAVIKFTYTSKSLPGIGCDPFGFQILELTPTALLKKCDFDNDGIPDDRDFDSDNDGCPDAREAGHGEPVITNENGDPVVAGEVGANGMSSLVETNDTPVAGIDYIPEASENNQKDYLNPTYRLVCDAVTAIDDAKTTPEDTPVSGNVITDLNAANEKDSYVGVNKTLTITKFLVKGVNYTAGQTATIPNIGTLKINSDGSYTFTPVANFNGVVPTVTYTVSEGKLTDFGDLNITVTPVNDPPVAVDNSNTTLEDTPLNGSTVLADDSDLDNDQLTLTQFVIDNVTYLAGETASLTGIGTLRVNSDGTYVFTPALNYNGAVPVSTYTVSDGKGGTNTATLTIFITPVNDVPVAVNDQKQTQEDVAATGNVLTNDSDVDGDVLAVETFAVNGTTYSAGETATISGVGTLKINADGSFTFTPAANYNGAVPVADYTVNDGKGGKASATLTITIVPENDIPVAINDQNTTDEDVPVSSSVLPNDSDLDGDVLTVSGFTVNGSTITAGQTGTISGVGTIVISSDGSYTFTPAANFTGAVPAIPYTISDGNGGTATANLNITVRSVNDAPVAVNDSKSTPEDTPVSGNVITNDSDVDGDALVVTTFKISGVTYNAGQTATLAGIGTLVVNADGTFTFTPVLDYTGVIPVADYEVSDGNGGTASAKLTITINGQNDNPVALDDSNVTDEDVAVSGNVLPNDSDTDGDVLTVSGFTVNGAVIVAGQLGTITDVGTIRINADGSYTFTPALNFNGTVPAIPYTVSDGNGGTATAKLNISVRPVNDPPVAVNDAKTTPEDTPVTSSVITNDTDPENDALSVTSFKVNGQTYNPGETATISGVGTLVLNANGGYTFTPEADYNGTVPTVNYTITDGNGLTASADLQITVTPVNDPPVAGDDTDDTTTNDPVSGTLFTNDRDIDGDAFTVSGFSLNSDLSGAVSAGGTLTINNGQAFGTIVINADGTYTYTPATNFFGTVPPIYYRIKDSGDLTSNIARLDIVVISENEPPVAVDDVKSTPEDEAVSGNVITDPNGNNEQDSDPNGDSMLILDFTISGTTYPAGTTAPLPGVGTLVIRTDGTYTFTPALNYNGPVPQASYTLADNPQDGNDGTDIGTLTITILPVNDAPKAINDINTTAEDTPVSGSVLTNDSDLDGDVLTVSGFTADGQSYAFGQTATITGKGTLVINANGTYTFTPAPNFNGVVPAVAYTISDGNGGSATANLDITVTPVNDDPVAAVDVKSTPEDTPVSGNVLTNDSDVDGDALSVSTFKVDGVSYTAGSTSTIPGKGTLTVNVNGSWTFTPEANFNGTVPQVTYDISDGNGGKASSTLDITVSPVNDTPVAINDSNITPEDTPVSGNVLPNDSDLDGDVLTVSGFGIGAQTFTAGQTATITGKGTILINGDGSYTFTPELNFNGAVPSVRYTISDGNGGTATADLTITVTPVNDNPVALADTKSTPEDTPVSDSVLPNDSDVDGDVLSVTTFAVGGQTYTAGQTATIAGKGALVINAGGSWTFTPELNFNGTVPQVTYSISDGNGGTASSTLDITVTPVNDSPKAVTDNDTTPEDTPLNGNVLPNDSDLDGDGLTVSGFSVGGQTYAVGQTATIAGKGTIVINANGTYSFIPALNFNGAVPAVTYSISDGNGGTASADLNITVTPVNDAPVAAADVKSTPEDTPVSDSVLPNDSDVDGDILAVTSFQVEGQVYSAGSTATISGKGTLLISANGSWTFTPVSDFNGVVPQVGYSISDGNGGTASSTLDITVTPVNDNPVAANDTNTTPEDTAVSGTVLPNDSDVDGDALSVTGFSVGGQTYTAGQTATITGKGTILINADGSYTFTPALNFNGTVPSIEYTISDGNNGTANAKLDITVTPVNDAPVAGPDVKSTPEDTPVSGSVLPNDSDVDGDALSVTGFSVDGQTYLAGQTASIAGKGTIVVNTDGSYTFTPAQDFNGTVPAVNYTVSDGKGGTANSTLDISVTPVNDNPVAGNDTATTPEDTPASGNVLSNDSDVDGDALTVTGFSVDGQTYTAGQTATIAGKGSLVLNADGSWTFTPAPDFNGAVPTVNYTVSDGNEGTASAALDITVTPVNDPPVANDDTGTATEDQPANGNVLPNDTDQEGDPLKVDDFTINGQTYPAGTEADIPAKGKFRMNEDGSWNFTPAPNYDGPVPPVDYSVSDGKGGTDTGKLDLDITPVNDPPVAENDSQIVPEGTDATGNLIDENDSDIDTPRSGLSVTRFVAQGVTYTIPPGGSESVTFAGVGVLTISSDGSYVFVPVQYYNGDVPPATYTLSDGEYSDDAVLNISVASVNDPPVAVNDQQTVTEDTPASGDVVFNDSDVDGNTLKVTGFTINGASYLPGETAVVPGVGSLVINENGSWTFTPAPNYIGAIPVASYAITDGLLTAEATLTLTMGPVNDPPVAVDDPVTAEEDKPAEGNVLGNDSDNDGDPLTVDSFKINGQTYPAGASADIPGVGTLELNPNGSFKFTPAPDYDGPVPPVDYAVKDPSGATDTGRLNISITPKNDPPVAADDTGSAPEDQPVSGNLLDNDTDVEDDPLSIDSFSVNGQTYQPGQTAVIPGYGSLLVNPDGTFNFTPEPDFNGSLPPVDYTVSDGKGGTDTGRLNLSIDPVNDPPVAVDDLESVQENGSLTANVLGNNVLGNDSDVDNDPLSVSGFSINGTSYQAGETAPIPGVGTFSMNADGTFTFTPDQLYDGPVPDINYTLSDGKGGTDEGTLKIKITPNPVPLAVNDEATATEDSPVSGNVLGNDQDSGNTGLSVKDFTVNGQIYSPGTSADIPGVGSLTINTDGSFTFTPLPNYAGPVPPVGYTLIDGNLEEDKATLNLSITPVNDFPVAADDSNTTPEDTPTGGQVLLNDSDTEFETLTVTSFTIGGQTYQAGQTATIANVGDLVIGADGKYTFTPVQNFNGSVPDVGYSISDGSGGTASAILRITVTPVNDPPVAADDTNTATEDSPVSGTLLPNDTDLDGDNLSVSGFSINGASYQPGETATIPGIGSLTINTDGTYTFTPVPDYFGPVPTADYAITDGKGGTDSAQLKLDVAPVNDPPVANDDSRTATEDEVLAGYLLGNDSDKEFDPLTVSGFEIGGTSYQPGQTATIPGVGELTINADGSFRFVPAPDYNGPVPPAGYTISDGNGGTDSAVLNLSVLPVNDDPVATDDSASVTEDTPASGNVLPNDSDIDGDPLSVTEFKVNGITYPAGSEADIPGIGKITLNSDGSWTFTPAKDYNGFVPSIDYTISDGKGGSDTGALNLDVTPVNDPPVATDDTAEVIEDEPASGNVLPNDTDTEGDPLEVTQFKINGTVYTAGQTATISGVGDLVINADGSWTFTPVPNYNGPVPAADYTISDGNGGSDIGVLNLNVTPVNDPPVATDDAGTVTEDTPASGNVLPNDSDLDGDPLSVADFTVNGITYPAGTEADIPGIGKIRINTDGTWTFTPAVNYNGPVPPIDYTLSDGEGGTDTGTLNLNVTPVNDAPVATDDARTTVEDQPVNGNVLPNDSDTEGSPITVTGFTISGVSYQPGQTATITGVGTFTMNQDGGYTFTPVSGYEGAVPPVSYTISDGELTDSAVLNITVTPIIDITANDDNFRFTVINAATGGNAGNVFDNDIINRNPAVAGKGDITVVDDDGLTGIRIESSGNVIIPPGTKPGTYTITYRLCAKGDPNNCDTATVVIEVADFGILVPEGISPDGDGLNDTWVIRGLENYPNNEVTLYNRWGNLIIRRKPYKNDWDGKSDNALTIGGDERVPAGTYFWVIELGNGKKLTGFVYVAY